MSEEEKKAIEWLKNATFFSDRIYAPTVLNLIDKQQKEIEYLKEVKWYYENSTISKDTIREFVKEELPDDEIMETCDNYDSNGVYIRKKLEELLRGIK